MMDRRLLGLVPGAMRHVAATVAWQWVGLAGSVALAWGVSLSLAALLAGRPVSAEAPASAALVALAVALRAVSARLAARESFAASQDVKRVLRRRVYEKLLALGPSYTRSVATSEVVQLSVEGTEQLETYFGQYLPRLFYAALAPVTLFAVVAPLSLPSAAVLLACVPLIPAVIVAVQKVARRVLGSYWDQYAELGDSFLENLQGLTTLKVYDADAARHAAMNEEAERFRVVTMKVLSMQLNSIIVMDVVALGGAVAGIAVALAATAAGELDPLGCLFVILVSAEFFLPMRQLGSFFHVAMNGIAASERIFRLLALPELPARPLVPAADGRAALADASFSYEPGVTALDHVTLEVARRGVTAVVGESGFGKSTVAALLAGRLEGYEGGVVVGGREVRDANAAALARHVTTVGLEAHLFAGSVRDNLLMSAPDATDGELWDALERVRLAGFVRERGGLGAELVEGARNLSGGQRQRLALARALLSDAALYVLDEATSNVDVESEEAIMGAVRELARTRPVVMISHRLANAVGAERVYVLDRGRVAGAGSHGELLAGCAEYAALWEAQYELERYASGAVAPGASAASKTNKTSKAGKADGDPSGEVAHDGDER